MPGRSRARWRWPVRAYVCPRPTTGAHLPDNDERRAACAISRIVPRGTPGWCGRPVRSPAARARSRPALPVFTRSVPSDWVCAIIQNLAAARNKALLRASIERTTEEHFAGKKREPQVEHLAKMDAHTRMARASQPVMTVNILESRARRCCLVAAALVLMAGCSGSSKPRVDRMQNGVYQPEKVSGYSIAGARDGASTHAVGTFTMTDGDTIRVELEVTYNPTPELVRGHWQRRGHSSGEGSVHAESLKFLGGQGATPSVGGRFRLDQEGSPLMRVTMPAQPLERPAP
jgi:hypothetical protein